MATERQFGEALAEVLGLHADVQPAEYLLKTELCTIGRAQTCEIIVLQHLVSRLHAKIERRGPRFVLQDADSANGTYVNSRRLFEPHLLKNDDLIGLGSPAPMLRFLDPNATFQPTERLHYDQRAMIFLLGNQLLELPPMQFRLLHHLYTCAGRVCSRESCAQAIWGRDYDPGMDAGALDEAISKLRRQIRLIDSTADIIKNRRGLGYELEI